MIKIPKLTQRDPNFARLALAFGFEEQIKTHLGGDAEAVNGYYKVIAVTPEFKQQLFILMPKH